MSNFISVSEESAKRLLQMIVVEKKYLPGQKIPNEKQLSELLSVSRTSVREAVKVLITNGVLEIRRGVGTFVTEAYALDSGSLSELCSEESKQSALEALYIRLVLEPEMIKKVITDACSTEKELIYQYEEACRSLILANKDYTYEDHLFHKSIAAASHNATYEKLIPILHTSITLILQSPNFRKTSELSAKNALVYHKTLVDAIKNKDIKGAEIASKTHIYNSISYLKNYYN